MSLTEGEHFSNLLTKVEIQFREVFPEVDTPIDQWKGNEIALFREELLQKCGGQISEKWFYTHIKNRNEKLPRFDTLDLLAQYVGYTSWKNYVFTESTKNEEIDPNKSINKPSKKQKSAWIIVACFVFVIIASFFYLNHLPREYSIRFLDLHSHKAVHDSSLVLIIDEDGRKQSLMLSGFNIYSGTANNFRGEIQGRYYKSKNFEGEVKKQGQEFVFLLQPDDYAMMIHMISQSDIKDWKRRRDQLSTMIHDDVQVYQVTEDGYGIDVFNKSEFIKRLTMPIKNLKNIHVVKTEYKDDQIIKMRFIQY